MTNETKQPNLPEAIALARVALWVVHHHNKLYYGESHNTVTQTGEALAALESLQVSEPVAITYVPGDWYKCHSIDEMQAFFMSRLPAIREAARELGYAIGVHGSCRRDFDLMAMQWRDDAATPDELAIAIQHAACGISAEKVVWEKKPNGRIATSLCICWTDHSAQFKDMLSVGHIDLSVIDNAAPCARCAELEATNRQLNREVISVGDEAEDYAGKLAALEAENKELKSLVVMGFWEDEHPQFKQGYDCHEMIEPLTAEQANGFIKIIAQLKGMSDKAAVAKSIDVLHEQIATLNAIKCDCKNIIPPEGQSRIECSDKQMMSHVKQQAERIKELEHKEVFDADNPRFREVLEETFLAVGLPFKRQGETYRSPITRWCFHVAYGVVNRLRLYEK